MKSKTWWFSSRAMTVRVDIDKNGKITGGAPIIRKFLGQCWENLERWMKQQGGFKKERIKT